jgi:hypothetical protein
MKKSALLSFLFILLAAIPMQAIERHQSFFSYDDGGTVVRQGDDGREIEARVNLPVYPGDEVVTSRRGRAEVHLSDGNTLGIDRASAIRFRSILDSYEGESDETVAELRYGKVAIYRTDLGHDVVRLDTENASYVATIDGTVYSVESDAKGRDRVAVFDGSIEVRTPSRTTRLRAGEGATVDDRGVYDQVGNSNVGSDDFERWFLRRAERLDGSQNRYIGDRRLSYWADDLDSYGRWVNVSGIGWSWRPYAAAGWRPYYNGYWSHRFGCLTWVSYDAWGFVPYHYGRWAYDAGYGWVWVPGGGYSPAWVYWMYGDNYIGWAPAGYWDCYRPYYNWAYNPYRGSTHFGIGFNGSIRISDIDLRPWTFVDPTTIVSGRIDRAALTADAVRDRLSRGSRGGVTTVSGAPARFTREEFRDPAEAIRRRSLDGSRSGRETGAPPTDLSGFFRRDPEVASSIRDRVIRGRGETTVVAGGTPSRNIGGGSNSGGSNPTSGSLAPIGSGSLAPIGRGNVAPIGGGSVAPIGRGNTPPPVESGVSTGGSDTRGGGINRGGSGRTGGGTDSGSSSWRERVRGGDTTPQVTPAPSGTGDRPSRSDGWRRRTDSAPSNSGSSDSTRGSDVPRRVIDGIGGARVVPRDGSSTRGSRESGSSTRDSGSSRRSSGGDSGGSTRRSSGGDSGSSRSGGDSGGSSARGGDSGRSSAPPPPPPPPPSSNRDSGGRIKRNE